MVNIHAAIDGHQERLSGHYSVQEVARRQTSTARQPSTAHQAPRHGSWASMRVDSSVVVVTIHCTLYSEWLNVMEATIEFVVHHKPHSARLQFINSFAGHNQRKNFHLFIC